MSLVSEFHGDHFPQYDNIPTSWNEIKVNPETVQRDALGNAVLPQLKQDSFESSAKATAETAKKSKGFFGKIAQGAKSVLKAAKKHKITTALIAAGVAITAGTLIADSKKKVATEEKATKNNSQFVARSHQG